MSLRALKKPSGFDPEPESLSSSENSDFSSSEESEESEEPLELTTLPEKNLKGSIVSGSLEDVEKKYELTSIIGTGAYAKVFKATEKATGNLVAIKKISKARLKPMSRQRRNVQREVAIMKQLQHPHIVSLFDVYETSLEVILVMEFAAGGMLFTQIAENHSYGYDEGVARGMVRVILRVLRFMHNQGVAHRDLKPENILLMEPHTLNPKMLKVCDFGFAVMFGDGDDSNFLMRSYCGTPGYMAPEVVVVGDHGDGYDAKADIYSLGCIAYILLTGELPYDSDDVEELEEKTLEAKLEFPEDWWQGLSDMSKEFCRQCLAKDPKDRPSARELLKHPWFSGSKLRGSSLEMAQARLSQNGGIKGLMQRLKELRKKKLPEKS